MAVTLKPNLDVSSAQAQAIIDRAAAGRTATRISELQGGEISAVFEIELAGGPPNLVLKVYPDSMQWKMRKEVTVSRLLEGRLRVPAPRVILADDTKALLDLNFLVMTKLDGKSLLALEAGLDKAELYSVYAEMGQVLRDIRGIPMEAFGYIGPQGLLPEPFASNRAYMSFQFDSKLDAFAEHGGPDALAQRLRAFVERHAPLLDACARPSLCHYDFHTANILAEKRDDRLRLCGILDLENAIAGDPLMDIAKTLTYSARGDETKRTGLLAGYGTIERPHWRQTLALYQFYCVLELWCWWTMIGDHRAASIMGDLERYA
jgi:aminoglycoside phosphotransferase (APT) family kinase protein